MMNAQSTGSCQSNMVTCSTIESGQNGRVVVSASSSSASSTGNTRHQHRAPMTPPVGTPLASNVHHHQHGQHHSHHGHQHHSHSSSTNAGANSGHSMNTPLSQTGAAASFGTNWTLKNGSSGTANASGNKGHRVLVIRHGERVDFTFNVQHESWVSKAFDAQGRYKRFNINMPRTLTNRKDGFAAYATDTPLTEIGYLQAKLTGRALKEAGVKPTHVYVSPAYRSVQTCVGILKGMQSQSQNVSFNIEPGLFEWGTWFRPKLPSWMTPDEYASQGHPVNVHYKPIIARTEITSSESLMDYYNRSHKVVQRVLERHPEDCVILLVAHGASLDTCTRQICGGAMRTQQEFYSLLHQTPYLALASIAEDVASRTFQVVEPPILPFQHQGNASYDWHLLNAHTTEKA